MGPLDRDVVQDAIGMIVWLYGNDESRDGSLLKADGIATDHSNLDSMQSFGSTAAPAIDHRGTDAKAIAPPDRLIDGRRAGSLRQRHLTLEIDTLDSLAPMIQLADTIGFDLVNEARQTRLFAFVHPMLAFERTERRCVEIVHIVRAGRR